MSNIKVRIDEKLNQLFSFKRVGDWYRQGICPNCGKKELFTHAVNPRVVKCARLNKCGYEEHVKEICEDLFKDWSKDFPRTKENPNAAADAYLIHARGFNPDLLKGRYTQELFRNDLKYPNEVTATVRFKIDNGIYWERFIDRPERFGRQKANFIGKYEGLSWTLEELDTLCNAQSIWITEGIFNAIALNFSKQPSIATMSTSNYPSQILKQISDRCLELKLSRPRLRWAFDNDKAGKKAIKKFHLRALQEKWDSTAALPTGNLDWNDLFQRDLLHSEYRDHYKHFGELHIAETPEQAGLLIYNFKDARRKTFWFNHNFRLYWFNLDMDKYTKELERIETDPERDLLLDNQKRELALQQCAAVSEICNRQLNPLYFQRNEITDESWYYFQILNPESEAKATFTADQISARGKFAPRLLSVQVGAWWTGNDHQLLTFMKNQTERLREVKTIDFIGYTKDYQAYIFNQHAVYKGQVIDINDHDFYKVGRIELKTLANSPNIKLNPKKTFKPSWWHDFYRVRGVKGLIALAWWTGSYFAEQIRAMHSSFPFIEIVGEAGAGKSRLIEFMWKLSGRQDYEGFDANKSTNVAIYRNFAQISNLPVVLIEGDRNDQNGNSISKAKFSWDELKDAYNGRAIRSKGLKTAGNETYEPPFRGAIMISQNTQIQASEAILTRTLHLYFDRKGQSLETKRIVDDLDRMDIEDACTYMTHCLRHEDAFLKTYAEKLEQAEKEFHNNGITHTRIALCHAQVSALIDALAKHVLHDVIGLEEVSAASDMLLDMARERVDQLNGDHPLVEQFWDVYEYLNSSRSAEFTVNHYDHNAHQIAINLNEVYKIAAKNYQQLPDIKEIKNLLTTSRRYKFVDKSRVVKSHRYPADEVKNAVENREMREHTVRCWIFNNPAFSGTAKQ
ncbi:toprim domain-containing protein [Acinetobacter bereziniae]|uniref:toprim domain-containing protein n=1 Tax=Acinetobacter bereziniae TaxID=106648 RepID=UPI00300A4755